MSGDQLVAQGIAKLEQDLAVKKCLQALFAHELENADKSNAPYKEDYERFIVKFAANWEVPDSDNGSAK